VGVSDLLARLGVARLHLLLVDLPGALDIRVHVERACVIRGWRLALSPADADALVVCGSSADSALVDAVEQVWAQLPGPRVRTQVRDVGQVDEMLNGILVPYRGWTTQRDPGTAASHVPDDDHGMDDGGSDGEMADMDMDMSGPGGIPLASGEDDRDGLEMDVLHLQLGPVLAFWPSAIIACCTVHGDVITHVEVRHFPTNEPSTRAESASDRAVYRLHCVTQLLALAGAENLAALARGCRDRAADGEGPDLTTLRRRVERSRFLRWSLRDIGVIAEPAAREHGWPSAWLGDVYDRFRRLLEEPTDAGLSVAAVAAALPDLLAGAELASARLTVASLLSHPPATGAPKVVNAASGQV
jgi:hypothetical protein